MNAFFGRSDNNPSSATGRSWAFGGAYRQFLRTADVPNPSMTYLTLDEHPDSINDAFFVTDPAAANWQDRPASYHNGACGFSFADGHAEIHRWLGSKIKVPVRMGNPVLPLPLGNAGDSRPFPASLDPASFGLHSEGHNHRW